jgi:hypothetical protein
LRTLQNLSQICEVPDSISGKFANGEKDLSEEDEDRDQKIPSIGMAVNLEELCRAIVRRIYSMFASAVVPSCPNRVFVSCLTRI